MPPISFATNPFAGLKLPGLSAKAQTLREYMHFLSDTRDHDPHNFRYFFHHPDFSRLTAHVAEVRQMNLWCSLVDEFRWDTWWAGYAGVILGIDGKSEILYANKTPEGGWYFDINGEWTLYCCVERTPENMKAVESRIREAGLKLGIIKPEEVLKESGELVVKSPFLKGVYVNSNGSNADNINRQIDAEEAVAFALRFDLPLFSFSRAGDGDDGTTFLLERARDLCSGKSLFSGNHSPYGTFEGKTAESLDLRVSVSK